MMLDHNNAEAHNRQMLDDGSIGIGARHGGIKHFSSDAGQRNRFNPLSSLS